MQNPRGGSRPPKGGYWSKCSKQKDTGGKSPSNARNMNPRSAPFGPRHPPSQPRFPFPAVNDRQWRGPIGQDRSDRPWDPRRPVNRLRPPAFPPRPMDNGHGPVRPRLPWPFTLAPYRHPIPIPPGPDASKRESTENEAEADKKQPGPNIPPLVVDSSLPSFELQAQHVVQQCLISPERRKAVDNVVISDLHFILRPVLPDNVPIVYGSVATGLAWETSDVDCFIDSKRVPDGTDRVKLLLSGYKVFFRRKTFHNVVRIPNARVPLVKAVHTRTGIEIDISCTSESALHNTKLMEYLVQTDERIRPLIVLISLVYRLNGLSGTHRFVSYTQVLLVIFYLQNLDIPMLPPLRKIIYRKEDDPWPKDFTTDVHRHIDTNSSSLTDLFAGFFKFYDSFDFSTNVVSTYLGCPIPVESFRLPDQLPDELDNLKLTYTADPSRRNNFLDKTICVQDPMEHFINTTSYIQLKVFSHFKMVNHHLVEIVNDPETTWLDRIMKMAEETASVDIPKFLKPNSNVDFSVSYPFGSNEERLMNLKKDLLDVFKLLLFEVVEVNKEPEAKVRISEGQVHDRAVMIFELQTFFNVFTKRFKDLPKAVVENPALFESAANEMKRISVQMKKPTSSFHCEFTVKQPISPQEIPVEIKDINQQAANTFLHMGGMLRDNLDGLLASAWKYKAPNEQSSPVPELVVKKRNSPGTRFAFSFKKEENEEEEAWTARFKTELISLFNFLRLEHSEVTLDCQKTETLDEGESVMFAFRLSTPYNIFTKRFKNWYLQLIEDPGLLPDLISKISLVCADMNLQTVSTFHGELIVIRSAMLSPDQVFIKMCDINQDVHNNFSHYSTHLQMNFAGLLSALRAFRDSQSPESSSQISQSEPDADKTDNQTA